MKTSQKPKSSRMRAHQNQNAPSFDIFRLAVKVNRFVVTQPKSSTHNSLSDFELKSKNSHGSAHSSQSCDFLSVDIQSVVSRDQESLYAQQLATMCRYQMEMHILFYVHNFVVSVQQCRNSILQKGGISHIIHLWMVHLAPLVYVCTSGNVLGRYNVLALTKTRVVKRSYFMIQCYCTDTTISSTFNLFHWQDRHGRCTSKGGEERVMDYGSISFGIYWQNVHNYIHNEEICIQTNLWKFKLYLVIKTVCGDTMWKFSFE